MRSRFHLVQDRFYDHARALRAAFDERFAEPRSARADRFVWDYWHVPDQYTLLRTPAWEYFPRAAYRRFHAALVGWGRRTLGCWDVSPPWLSCYVEGCQQHLHADVPHGPWAWVYSLSPARPRFQGGETLIVRPEVLDYWPTFSDADDRELNSFVTRIAPRFDRLVAFDPRFPHGVTRVSGTHDPREGRLVVHGWFTEPRPFVTGGHTRRQVDRVLEGAVPALAEALGEDGPFHGMLSVRLDLAPSGEVTRVRALTSTLVCLRAPGSSEVRATRRVLGTLRRLRFGRGRAGSEVTLPLLFR